MSRNLNIDDAAIQNVLCEAQVIAVVGHSDKRSRTSYQIAQFLKRVGYRVYPVNPQVEEIEGQRCYPSLKEIPESIDIVNVFRRSEYLAEVVEDAIAVHAKTLWTQIGVCDPQAAKKSLDAGIDVVMDRCSERLRPTTLRSELPVQQKAQQ